MPFPDLVTIYILSSLRSVVRRHQGCDDYYEDDAQVSACVNLAMGIVGLFIWPAVVLAALSAAMDIWGAVSAGTVSALSNECS